MKKAGIRYGTAWHGTLFYGLQNIVDCKRLLESDSSKYAGHRCLRQNGTTVRGVYVTPSKACATGYAIPQNVFKDGAFHRAVLEVDVELSARTRCVNGSYQQWVFPSEAVSIVALWIHCDGGVGKGQTRLSTWDERLELPRRRAEQLMS